MFQMRSPSAQTADAHFGHPLGAMQSGVELQNFINVGVRRIETPRYKDSDRRVGCAHGPVTMLRGRGLRPRGVLANDRSQASRLNNRHLPSRRIRYSLLAT